MAKYRFTNKAVSDLSEIWNYTLHKWSENQADKYYHMLLKNCKEIAKNPEFGKNYSRIIEDIFGFKAGRHIIFYRKIDQDEVEITRILHEQMDLKNRIKTLQIDKKKVDPQRINLINCAQDWTRTSTTFNGHQALNLTCLPISPPGRV